MADQPSKKDKVWGEPGPNACIYSGQSRDIEILKNNVEILRSSLDDISSALRTLDDISTSFSDLLPSVHILNEKVDTLWNAPGMPGYETAKTSWDEKKN